MPGLGRSDTTDTDVQGQHLAERCQLFTIVAFGESILATGATFADEEPTAVAVASLAVAFAGNVALGGCTSTTPPTGRPTRSPATTTRAAFGRTAYTYLHVPMVAGVLVTAVGDTLALGDPGAAPGPGDLRHPSSGGPALSLAGHALFKGRCSSSCRAPAGGRGRPRRPSPRWPRRCRR